MDGQIKVSEQGTSDENLMHFQGFYASPAKSDASSVDIYDGLDMQTETEQADEKNSPTTNCLDLYEEIITEEGTAKEASFQDLNSEYEKCQRQMKQLITKLKEMQSLNSSLQNENQCLKKNISALIKTARVEITRKEEEINRLNQRSSAPGKNHSFKPSLPLLSISKSKSNTDDLSKNIRNTESLLKKSNLQSKALTSSYSKNLCDKEKTCMATGQTCTSINPIAKPCKENTVCHSQEQTVEPLHSEVNDREKKEMGLDTWNKDRERNKAKERPKSNGVSSVSENPDEKVQENAGLSSLKCRKNEFSQESKNSKSGVVCETEIRKYHSSSTKEKTQLKDLDYTKEKHVKKYERSPNRRESRKYENDKNTEARHRTAEKHEEPRRSKRTHLSTVKDYCSHKLLELSDGKIDSDSRRKDKHSSEYRDSKYGNKDLKPNRSEHSTRNKSDWENKTERSNRDRRGEEKKSTRDEQDGSRYDRKDKVHQTKDKGTHQSSSKDKALHLKVSPKNKNGEKVKLVDGSQKDLKLSFMETLNLTLSPTKKTSADTEQVFSSAPSLEREVEENLAIGYSQLCITENRADSLCPEKIDLRHTELVLKANRTKVLNTEDSKPVSQSSPIVDKIQCMNKQAPNVEVDENNELLAKFNVDDKLVVFTTSDTVSTKDSLVGSSDVIDLGSFVVIDRCSGSPSSESPNVSMADEQIEGDGSILEQSEDADNKTVKLKANLTETPKGICDSPYTELVNISTKGIENKHCFHDESSIDLNFLKPIPKILSPLKSPVRSKALHTLDRTAKVSVVSGLHKELLPEANTKSTHLSVSEELNKENYQPDNKEDYSIKTAAVASSDEVEEGEILPEDEVCQQTTQNISTPSQLLPNKVTKVTKSQDSELPLSKSTAKHKAKVHTPPKVSAFSGSTQRKLSADSCLDGILKIVTPSSIQDILQMLRIIRKHIRKKYMKFKILFSLSQFHRVIEAATLYFITLVRSLDWSSLCSSPEILQKKLCKHIETRLQKVKKNGIVDRIFEQHLINMKKSLWNFVEEQLDSLFDTLKAVIVKLSDKVEIEKNTATCTNTPKSDPVNSCENKKRKLINKTSAPSESVPCLRRLEFHSQTRVSNPSTQNDDNGVQKELVKELTGIGFNYENIDSSSSNVSSTSKLPHSSLAKTSTSNETCFKSQVNSSGLSFNLVSDDHMGDIFKSLLHDPDTLPSNTLPESMWVLGTPEKTASLSHKFDNVDSLPENKMPTEAAFSWSSISPPHTQTLSRIETVLNPDVLDESCLLEVPTSASPSKTLNGSEDRLKFCSSVLMEDLAVSLTVPSPLKSDSHLSFLRPACDAEPVSEVDTKCCEGSALDEEDATEQDIHLTLDSDNSSIGSLEDTGELGSFQYNTSEPMQAVVMEKSNDHFIVKIRRAVFSSSPVCDCLSEETYNAAQESLSTVEGNKLEMEVKLDTQSEVCNGKVLFHPENLDLANVTEGSIIDVEIPERAPLTVQENKFVFKLPPSRSQNLEIPAEIKLSADDIVEHTERNCENVTNCIEETCSQLPPAEILPVETSGANTVDLHLKKKKRKSLDKESSAKRQKTLSSPNKDEGTKHIKIEDLHLAKSNKKKSRRAVSDGAINFHCSKVSPTNLSAKNVIKKRGEVVVSWTRDEDRAILIECQKIGPTKKTFLFLSSTMNKYPHQVEERFQQLMKLFKKSRNSSS